MLSHVPQAEKFAKFWTCKAKLLARSGPFDVMGLYKAAVCAGAVVSEACFSSVAPHVPHLCSSRFPQDPGVGFWDEFSSTNQQ